MITNLNIRDLYRPVQPAVRQTDNGVSYLEVAPAPGLRNLIYCYWQLKTTSPLAEPYPYRVVADGCMDIFFEPGRHEEQYVMGFCNSYTEFSLGTSFYYAGIRFLPAALPQLYRIDAAALTNRCEQLEDVAPETAEYIANYTGCISAPGQLKSALDEHFLSLIARAEIVPDYRVYRAVEVISRRKGEVKAEENFDGTGISRRQLRRLFNKYIGDTPKAFSRIVRFQHVLNTAFSEEHLLHDPQYFDAGFYDQAHFIKEFKTFYGSTPSQALYRRWFCNR